MLQNKFWSSPRLWFEFEVSPRGLYTFICPTFRQNVDYQHLTGWQRWWDRSHKSPCMTGLSTFTSPEARPLPAPLGFMRSRIHLLKKIQGRCLCLENKESLRMYQQIIPFWWFVLGPAFMKDSEDFKAIRLKVLNLDFYLYLIDLWLLESYSTFLP